jgi:hypothetical protein
MGANAASALWRAAITRCSAIFSAASRCDFNFSAKASGCKLGARLTGATTAGLGAKRGAMGAAFATGATGLLTGAAGLGAKGTGAAAGFTCLNSFATRGMAASAGSFDPETSFVPMPKRSRQLRLSLPPDVFWSITLFRSYISSTGLTPRTLRPLPKL